MVTQPQKDVYSKHSKNMFYHADTTPTTQVDPVHTSYIIIQGTLVS